MSDSDIFKKFDEKITELEISLPEFKIGVNCAALTLNNILDVLGIENYLFNNLAIPLSGGFGGYKSKSGWQGACGAVCGGCAAIGIIMGGHEKAKPEKLPIIEHKASQFASNFEKKYGSVVCADISRCDFSTIEGMNKYKDNNVWENLCYKFIIWAILEVKRLTKRDLKKKWE